MRKRWLRSADQGPSPWSDALENGERGFWLEEPDPADLPRYESEAAFLKRLELLLPGEERRLRPKDYEPEAVEP